MQVRPEVKLQIRRQVGALRWFVEPGYRLVALWEENGVVGVLLTRLY